MGGRGRVFATQDRRGEEYGMLTVRTYEGRSKSGQVLWGCACSCGSSVVVANNNLSNGHTSSCGCIRVVGRETHGLSYHPLYAVWENMMRRCYDPSATRYGRYGGRGVIVCKRWHDIRNFITDMGPRPKGLTLERKESNGHYTPRNCKWGTWLEQANNKSNNVVLTLRGVSMTTAQWARKTGIAAKTLRQRVARGWSTEDVLTTLAGQGGRKHQRGETA